MNPFTDHPREQGEGYFQHLRFAMQFGVTMFAGGAAAIVHALLPFMFKRTGSSTLAQLNRLLDQATQRRLLLQPVATHARLHDMTVKPK